jgi:hypothetical protein
MTRYIVMSIVYAVTIVFVPFSIPILLGLLIYKLRRKIWKK